MLFCLIDRGFFTEQEIVDEFGLSRPSFFRALSDFRCYLQEHRPQTELVYEKETKHYRFSYVQ